MMEQVEQPAAQPPAQPAPEQAAQPATPAAPGGNPEQGNTGMADAFKRVVEAAMRVIYSKSTSDGVVGMLQKGDPVNALAQTTLFVMKALFDESKGKIPAPVMVPASRAVLSLLAEMGTVMGLQMDEEATFKGALQLVEGSLNKRFGGEQPQEQQQPEQPQKPGIINQAMEG